MTRGEKAEIVIQPDWAYGRKGLEGKYPFWTGGGAAHCAAFSVDVVVCIAEENSSEEEKGMIKDCEWCCEGHWRDKGKGIS